MYYARLACFLGALCITSILASGCVQTAMLPARQLESGTTVASTSLDEPGRVILPRLNAQVTHGLGGGDFTVNLSVPPFGGGLTGRYYLTDRASAKFQLQVAPLRAGATGLGLVGIQETPTREDSWYFGAQLGTINGVDQVNGNRKTTPVIGGSAGYGPVDLGSSWQMQVEFESNVPLSTPEGHPPVPATRLSIGFFHLFR